MARKAPGELELIQQIRHSFAATGTCSSAVALGIGDDCAILRPPRGHELLVTTDFSLEGRHFRRDLHPPAAVGHRVLTRGLSDLAAMGARPLAAFLSLALPADTLATAAGRAWVRSFLSGLRSLARQHRVPLAGGDTSESPTAHILADIVLIGSAPSGRALRRSTARPGDALYVTGALGGAAAEFAILQRASPPRPARIALKNREADHPHLFPQPRLRAGQALLHRRLATAAIDLSDGLSTDLAHLCSESGVGAEVLISALPIHPLARNAGADRSLSFALHGGEDYELLFAAPPSAKVPRFIAGVSLTRIGTLTRGHAISLVDSAGRKRPLRPGGWQHFTGKR